MFSSPHTPITPIPPSTPTPAPTAMPSQEVLSVCLSCLTDLGGKLDNYKLLVEKMMVQVQEKKEGGDNR